MQARGEAVGIVGIPESMVWWLVEFRWKDVAQAYHRQKKKKQFKIS